MVEYMIAFMIIIVGLIFAVGVQGVPDAATRIFITFFGCSLVLAGAVLVVKAYLVHQY